MLRQGPNARLVFHPELVDNAADPEAAVRGVFTYQRKGRKDDWEDVRDLKLSKLRKGESVQLELHAAEVLELYRTLGPLYRIHEELGIPFGETKFEQRGREYWRALEGDADLRDRAFSEDEYGAIRSFAKWVAERPREATVALQALQAADLAALDAAAGMARLRRLLTEWQANRENADEGFWQDLLTKESWALGQLFGAPFVIVRGLAYVGGKTYENVGGRVADFLFKNRLTGNVVIVEIKTPMTPLLGGEYRQGVFPPSPALTGAITQALDQRLSLSENYRLLDLDKAGAVPFSPRTLVLAGDLDRQSVESDRLRSFELYRNELKGVEIVTFDELAAKAEGLLELFQGAPMTALKTPPT